MQKIKIKRPEYIVHLLTETQKEFARRGIEITIDQAHALHDFRHWTNESTLKATVDNMIKEHVELSQ